MKTKRDFQIIVAVITLVVGLYFIFKYLG